MRLHQTSVALALALASTSAFGAPMGSGVEAVAVLLLEADLEHDLAAKTLTNTLRQRVLDSAEFTLQGASVLPLVAMAHQAKCPLRGLHHPLTEASEKVFDAPCLRRVSAEMGTRRFFWGLVYVDGGATVARLHFWDGDRDRTATLPYDPAQRERVADRLYKKLVTPNAVGDVKVSGAFGGEMVVDGKPTGPYGDGVELTLETGEHFLEVRDGPRVVARGRTRIEPGGRSQARLTPIAEAAPSPSPLPHHDPPPIVVRPRPSAWPWVLGGVGVAGLAGAGAFWALREGVKGDLEQACAANECPDNRRDDLRRGNLYRSLSAVSLGVGVAAGAGLAIYLLTPTRRRPLPFSGALVPLAGGAAATVSGSF